MHWLDIVVIVILVLFALMGLVKGFLKSLLSLVNTLVSFVAAIFLAKPFAKFLTQNTHLNSWLAESFTKQLSSIEGFSTAVTDSTSAKAVIEGTDGITSFFKWLLPKIVGDGTIAAGSTPAQYFGDIVAGVVLVVICMFIMFIAIRILVGLLTMIFDKLKKVGIINSVDRLLGFLFGAIKGFIFFALVLIIVNFIPVLNSKAVEIVDQTSITKKCAEWVEEGTTKLLEEIDIKKLIDGIVDKQHEGAPIPADADPAPVEP